MKKFIFIFYLTVMTFVGAIAGLNFGGIDVSKALTDTGKLLESATGIGVQEEVTIGNSVAVEIVSKYGGLVRDEAIVHRVNLVGKSVARYCDRPELNYRFGVLNSTSVNAFSAPGGDIFITKGLYDLIQNDDQLAGVLAHEITHVSKRHALKIIERGEFMQGFAGWSQQVGAAGKKADLTNYTPGIKKIANTLFEKGFDPQTEFDADKGGFKLAATVGYAPNGLEQCLQTLKQHESPNTTFFPTHPSLDQRIKKLDSYQSGGI